MGQEPNHIDAAIADLEAWRERIQTTIDTLRHFRSQGPELPASVPPGARTASGGSDIAHDTFFQMSIPDAARKYLTIVKRTQPLAVMGEALLSGGLKSASQNFSENLRSIVARDDRFVRVNSEWGLAEWYPAMRREHKAKERPQKKGNAKRESKAGKKHAGESIPEKIKRFLGTAPGKMLSAEEIADGISANIDSVRARLPTMARSGMITKGARGMYSSTVAG
jgi:hypothetical protein